MPHSHGSARSQAPSAFDLLLMLRGIAAISVVIWHLEGYKGTLPKVLNTPGRTAVWIFFGISGYVIAHGFVHRRYSLAAPDLRAFFRNRFLRIYPLFLLLSLLAFVTLWVQKGTPPLTVADIPAQLFAFQFNHQYLLSGVFWTLGIELQFYLLAPLAAALLMSQQWILLMVPLYVINVWAYGFAVSNFGWSFDGRNILANLPHFLTGMMACRLASGRRVAVPAGVSLCAAISLVGYTSWLYHARPAEFWSLKGILLVDAAILLFVLAHVRLSSAPAPVNVLPRALAYAGVLSYGIYAWHAYLLTVDPDLVDHLFLLLLASVAASYVSYRLVERPALGLKRYVVSDEIRRSSVVTASR